MGWAWGGRDFWDRLRRSPPARQLVPAGGLRGPSAVEVVQVTDAPREGLARGEGSRGSRGGRSLMVIHDEPRGRLDLPSIEGRSLQTEEMILNVGPQHP